jgi:hypothetical protein
MSYITPQEFDDNRFCNHNSLEDDQYPIHPLRPLDIQQLPPPGVKCCYIIVSIINPKVTYIGFTKDLKKRLNLHNAGLGSKASDSMIFRPYALVGYVVGCKPTGVISLTGSNQLAPNVPIPRVIKPLPGGYEKPALLIFSIKLQPGTGKNALVKAVFDYISRYFAKTSLGSDRYILTTNELAFEASNMFARCELQRANLNPHWHIGRNLSNTASSTYSRPGSSNNNGNPQDAS